MARQNQKIIHSVEKVEIWHLKLVAIFETLVLISSLGVILQQNLQINSKKLSSSPVFYLLVPFNAEIYY